MKEVWLSEVLTWKIQGLLAAISLTQYAKPNHCDKFLRPTSDSSQSIRSITLLVGTLLVVSTHYWVASTWNGFTLASLFINAIVITFILGLLTVLLLKLRKTIVLRPAELILVYVMLTSATAAAGHDTLEILTQIVAYPIHFASPENDWKSIFFIIFLPA